MIEQQQSKPKKLTGTILAEDGNLVAEVGIYY